MNKGIPFIRIAGPCRGDCRPQRGSESAGLRCSLSNRQPATLSAAALRRESWSMVNKESVKAATETTKQRWSAVSPFADPLKMEIQ